MTSDLVGTSQEPAGRSSTGSVAWKKHYGFEFFPGYSSPLYVYRGLEGIAWTCPKCGHDSAVVLRYRSSNERYTFCCTDCSWQENFNYVHAEALLESLHVDRP